MKNLSDPQEELQTGTVKTKIVDMFGNEKYGTFEAINGCIANDLQKEVDKLTKALKDISEDPVMTIHRAIKIAIEATK